jgi:mutator protein MutT
MNSKEPTATPPLPVVSVRLIVTNKDGRVLILRRPLKSHGAEGWCLPGGKIDFGATAEQTAVKELAEETALTCTNARFLFYQDSLPSEESAMHVVNLYFACEVEGQLRLNEESTDSAWISADNLADYRMVFRNDEGLRRYWELD